MRQPTISSRTFPPTIPTNLSATQATQSNSKNSSPTLSSLIKMQASFFSDNLFNSPLLPATILDDNDFQSNSRVQNDPGSALSHPPLNGLGIYYSGSSGLFKPEDVTEQELLAPFTPSGCYTPLLITEPPLHDEPTLNAISSSPDVLGDSFFTDVGTFLDPDEGTTATFFRDFACQDSSSLSSSSSSTTRSMDEGLSDVTVDSSYSRLAVQSQLVDGSYKPRSPSPAVIGPFADINMFNLAYLNRGPEAGINPADITGPLPTSTNTASSLFGDTPTATSELPSAEVMDSIISMLSNNVTEPIRTPQSLGPTASQGAIPRRSKFIRSQRCTTQPVNMHGHDTKLSSPEGLDLGSCLPAVPPAARRSPLVGLSSNQQVTSLSAYHDDTPCSPVLNAHHGVDLSHLLEKAESYRKRYPGRELDKKWLMAYAGKLSRRGEMLEDYRCYVNGCTQRNKRRDHILVHVGSHVDQRPFACNACPMRFLRKNECRRHEAGHTGERPFLCDLCPIYEEKSFVRQDLLKRHLKRAHGFETTENQSQARRPVKKVKLE